MADLPEEDDIMEQHPANDEALVSLIALDHAHDTIKLTRSKTTLGRNQGIDAFLLKMTRQTLQRCGTGVVVRL